MKTPCSLADAVAEIGFDALVERLIACKLVAVGLEFGLGLPIPIPAEHFMVPKRSTVAGDTDSSTGTIDGATQEFLCKLYPEFDWTDPNVIRRWRKSAWVDPDYDERTGEALSPVYPVTCLDIDGSAIYADGQPHWTDILIVALNAEGANNQKRGKGGRKPEWPWDAIEKFVFDRMDHHGEFSPDDPDWHGVADLEREIQKQFPGAEGAGPAHSTLQEHLPGMIERWRREKSSQ